MNTKALRLITKCLETKDPYLELSNCGLTDKDFEDENELAVQLRQCTHLQTLIVNNNSNQNGKKNYLTIFPKSLFELKELSILVLCGNESQHFGIKELPIGNNFNKLTRLNVSFNKIKAINGLENLTNLKQLDVSNNQLRSISGLENLLELQMLELDENQIEVIENLENLVQLRHLNIYNNPLLAIGGLDNLVNLKHLTIGGNRLECIRGLENLPNLQQLTISHTRINSCKGLNKLYKLTHLHLNNNRLSEITDIENLSELKHLNLSGNKISSSEGFDHNLLLQYLDLSNNQIEVLGGLGQLKQLRHLELASNQITDVSYLKFLPQLRYIDLSHNSITKLNGITGLMNLQHLFLNYNKIDSLGEFEGLISLMSMDISYNEISDITNLVVFIQTHNHTFDIIFKEAHEVGSNEISVWGNPLLMPPFEVATQGSSAILNYFAEIDKQGVEYLNEAKLLLVGQPRAGKTSLRIKLLDVNAELPNNDRTTRGIDVDHFNFKFPDKNGVMKKFCCHIWDFGGQQIYQATHQFFITQRSLYVLVLDSGKDNFGDDDNTINYWLQIIELLGTESPLLIVKNEKQERQIFIDLPQKKTRFKFIKNEYSVDLNALIVGTPPFNNKRLKEFSILKEDIETELKRLPLVGFAMPKNWIQIRRELQIRGTNKPYIDRKEYFDICNRYGVTEFERQMELSRIFHDLGVFLHFQDYGTLEDFIILQNSWITDAVFAVLDNKNVQKNNGKFTELELSDIWKNKLYEFEAHNKLLSLMIRFELCYQVRNSPPRTYIIPEMLSGSPLDGYKWLENQDLPLQYNYDFMPKGILTRLIVRMNKYIYCLSDQQVVWKTGVVIDGQQLSFSDTICEISEAWTNKQINIKAQGRFARELINIISYNIDEINNEFFSHFNQSKYQQGANWYKMIACNCDTCSNSNTKNFYDYRELLDRQEYGAETIECRKRPFLKVDISNLLDGTLGKGFKDIKNQKLNLSKQTIVIFLASSSELTEERKEFEIFISRENKKLNKKNVFLQLVMWEDFLDTLAQTRLQEEYNKAVKQSDIFVMLYFTKVGMYTAEEFENAFQQFKKTNTPKIFTYFKKGNVRLSNLDQQNINSLFDFQKKLKELGHFQTEFEYHSDLHFHFKEQLELLYDI